MKQAGHKKRLVILDTHAILHRAYHALPDFSSSKGEPTGALYGLITMLVKLIHDLGPDYIAAGFDLPQATHRHLAYENYKATRAKTDDALVEQIKRSRDVLAAFGIPLYEHPGFEADDVIGTIVEELKNKKDVEIIIASGDMDTLQLVSGEQVRVFTLKKGITDTVLYDEAAVRERYGFGPELIPDYKGLRGDPSDNIIGVKGIGDKTASALIQTFGSIEAIYKALKKDAKSLEAAGVKGAALQKLTEQEEEARFSKMLAEIRRDAPIDFKLPSKTWKESADSKKALDLLAEFEFRSLIPRVRGMFATVSGQPEPAVEDKPLETHGQAQMFESDVPADEAAKLGIAAWLIDSNLTEPTLEDIYRVAKANTFEEAKNNILAEIKKQDLTYVYEKIELPLMPVLRRAEKRGMLIDTKFLGHLAKTYRTELDKQARKIFEHAGGEFNINSPKQLGEVLFDKLGLAAKNQKKTAGGARSTRESELEKLRDQNPIIDEILSYRELQKLLSTYIDTIPTLLDDESRLHTRLVQTGTTTGRISSKDPNLQNIPVKSELGRKIRDAFIATPGFSFVSLDYSQIELRIAAILSGDENLSDIFKQGGDVHAEVASRVFGVMPKDVSYEQRRRAKVINFGLLYGMGVNALRQGLGTSRAEAQEFYDQYLASFPRLAAFLEETKADAARTGYTKTLFGRRRNFEGIRSKIPFVRAAAERMAINAPMQGTQSDIIKLAMVEIDEMFEREHLRDKAHLLLQVHDELLFEIKTDIANGLIEKIRTIMESVLPDADRRGVPIKAEGGLGESWGAVEKI